MLKQGLGPYVDREINQAKRRGFDVTSLGRENDRLYMDRPIAEWDAAGLLRAMWDSWNSVFRTTLGHEERTLVSELRSIRDRWAHQQSFSFDDTYRALDSIARLLNAVSAEAQASEVERSREELMRLRYEEQARNSHRRLQTTMTMAHAASGLPPWREIITPHDDVARGSFKNAEFAADLWQVYRGEAEQEYQDPQAFFLRTYLTESLTGLLANALIRLNGLGGDPVVQLQTNFGGGKTHAMLAIYQLASGAALGSLPGIDAIMAKAEIDELPKNIRRVVLVGNKISPASPVEKPDGTLVRTLWGELAYQLGGKQAYDRIALDDLHATSPGQALHDILADFGPAVILIDEWVAYARQLHEDADLAGGSFETQFTFAQTLTEAVTTVPNVLLVVSLPASDSGGGQGSRDSDIEVGGEFGQRALERLRNVFGRIDSNWRPANQDESFAIVRRRLFDQIPTELYPKRDAVAHAFVKFYQNEGGQFPSTAKEAAYERAIKDAYPIHPEVFARLYGDWSTLPRFQRTRGVLRLMAAVIHTLWENNDQSPLILPCHLPLDNEPVRTELTHYLPDQWNPVIDRDVDSERSTARLIDNEVTSLGRYQISRRVMRTLFLDTAATQHSHSHGVDLKMIKLGSIMPGEGVGLVDDALRRLVDQSTYLNADDGRFWLDVQPTVTQLANERIEQILSDPDKTHEELARRMREIAHNSSAPIRVHVFPSGPADIADEPNTRLVILGPEAPARPSGGGQSEAIMKAERILQSRGNANRRYRNALVFLAPDESRLRDLMERIARYLAWTSIYNEREELDLSPTRVKQCLAQRDDANERANAQIRETFKWILVPHQPQPRDTMRIQEHGATIGGNDDLVAKVVNRLEREDEIIQVLGANVLRRLLDEIPLWPQGTILISELMEYFASYVYLPRLLSSEVLLRAIESGASDLMWDTDTFAYAESWDEVKQRFVGVKAGQSISLSPGDPGMLVRPDLIKEQLPADPATPALAPTQPREANQESLSGSRPKKPSRYHARVELDPLRSSEASNIYKEVITQLTGSISRTGSVRVYLEIEAVDEEGFDDNIVRVVHENGTTLKFMTQGFEDA
jgi:predicted AAA+ superfamily ATPase